MRKFDRTGDHTITFDDFIQCCVLIQVKWRGTNHTKTSNCHTVGFNLSPKFYRLVTRKFDRDGTKRITFDDFIQCIVIIQVSTLYFDT